VNISPLCILNLARFADKILPLFFFKFKGTGLTTKARRGISNRILSRQLQ